MGKIESFVFNTRQNLIESRQPGQATDLTDQTDKNVCENPLNPFDPQPAPDSRGSILFFVV